MLKDKELVEFKLDDGETIVFETDSDWNGGIDRIARDSESGVNQAEERFDAVVRRIRPAAQAVLDSLRELSTPSEIELEFGLKFSTKAGVIIASADSEVNFKVNIKWANPSVR